VVILLRSPPCALPTETQVESGTSQSKSGTSVNLNNSGNQNELFSAAVSPARGGLGIYYFRDYGLGLMFWGVGFGFMARVAEEAGLSLKWRVGSHVLP